MSLFIKLAASAVISALLLVGGIFTGEKLGSTQNYGATSFTPVQCAQTTLSGAGVNATQNTISLTSFTSQGGVALGMSNFGQIGYVTLEPNSPTKNESISFTGVTQNANGTAVLTGVTRGLDFVYPYVASSSLQKAHAGGAYAICSNTAPFYQQQFALVNNPSTIATTWTYGSTTPPVYDANPIWANFSTLAFASIAYVNSVAAAGAANASETVNGIGQLATAAQAALGTVTGSTGGRLLLGNNLATSTPTFQGTNVIPVTGTNEKLSQLFLDLTQAFSVSGLWNFSATTTMATSTMASSTITTANIGTGNFLTSLFVSPTATVSGLAGKFYLNTSPGTIGGTSSTTIFSVSIPANTLSTGNFVTFNIPISAFNLGTDKFLAQVGYGGATTSVSMYQSVAGGLGGGTAQITLAANGGTGSQLLTLYISGSGFASSTSATLSVDSTGAHQLVMIAQSPNYGGADSFTPILVSGVLSK